MEDFCAKQGGDTAVLVQMQKVQMQAMEQATGVGYWCLDLQSSELWWSEKTKEIHEVEPDYQPHLNTAIDCYVPEYRERILQAVDLAMTEGVAWNEELQIQTAKKRRLWVQAVGAPVYAGDKIVALAGSFRDISKDWHVDKNTRAISSQSEESVSDLQHASLALNEAAIVTTADLHGKITSVNQKLLDISGYSEAELIGADHNILNSGEHAKEFFADLWRTIGRGQIWRGEICNRRKDGRLYWVDTMIYPILDMRGRVEKYLSIRFDVTERVEASKLVTNFFDMSMAPHCIFDKFGRLQQVNGACCAMLHYSEQDLVGRDARDFIVADDHEAFSNAWRPDEVVTHSKPVRFRLIDADGQVRHTEWRTRTFGTLIFASGHDLTGEVERVDALKEAKRAAEEASLSKSAFLANMSHEIRTPLNAIVGVADALLDKSSLSAEDKNLIQMIFDSGKVLERQMSDVLDFSKIDAGKSELEYQPFSPSEMLKQAVAPHVEGAKAKGVEYHVEIEPAASLLVMGDDMRVRQIVSNLASNAVKFTAAGSITTRMSCVEECDTAALRITFVDTGVGFPKATQTDEFDRFDQKGRSSAEGYAGTGLGLAISSSLARQMGGRLSVVSAPGQGSTFHLDLPLRKAQAAVSATANSTQPPLSFVGSLKGRKVLIAEDIKANQKIVALLLKGTGCETAFANNGKEAIDLCHSWKPDLVLMDMMMPEMNGLEATREIRIRERQTRKARLPILMLSANAMREHVKQAEDAGCDAHISKPVNKKSLIPAILEQMNREGTPKFRNTAQSAVA
ncbi:PAS domain S-box protein [Shimia sp. R10_1]|uniref:PAS domain-containing hybrid sensor histidine kinase/response regulator n=1 Tax=Shimia sp. R10_1 TaxID=2821095 RepID=UPI001ADC15B7|nr:PAS domain S-box protein [Shimia sp. R10_1]MBO9472581.1 PAS domain S-box protein [Shimia sp. R10_1]